jgi:hypothetical protein
VSLPRWQSSPRRSIRVAPNLVGFIAAVSVVAVLVAACSPATPSQNVAGATGVPTTVAPTTQPTAAIPPTATPAAGGSFTVTLANVGNGHRGGPGSYQGQAEVDCSLIGGVWHASYLSNKAVDSIEEVTIAENKPAYVRSITTSDTDSLDWQVQQGFQGGTVTITVDDKGSTATLTAHAGDLTQKIDATLNCTTIVRG